MSHVAGPVRTRVLVVTGPPATGKTTLARRLAIALGAPLLSKDSIKEALFDALGSRDRAWSKAVGGAAFTTLFRLLDEQIGAVTNIVVEANFSAEESLDDLERILSRDLVDAVQVYCVDGAAAIAARYEERAGERHPGHADLEAIPEIVAGVARGRWRPLVAFAETHEVQFPPSDAVVEDLLRRLTA